MFIMIVSSLFKTDTGDVHTVYPGQVICTRDGNKVKFFHNENKSRQIRKHFVEMQR